MGHMQERMEEVEAKLKNVRMMLQEKVNQLKEQVGARCSALLIPKLSGRIQDFSPCPRTCTAHLVSHQPS